MYLEFAICECDSRLSYRGGKEVPTTNRILNDVIHNPKYIFHVPPADKYYVVDVGYPNRNGFLSSYCSTRYHLHEYWMFPPRGSEEMFNYLHSFLRNVIEISFGNL